MASYHHDHVLQRYPRSSSMVNLHHIWRSWELYHEFSSPRRAKARLRQNRPRIGQYSIDSDWFEYGGCTLCDKRHPSEGEREKGQKVAERSEQCYELRCLRICSSTLYFKIKKDFGLNGVLSES
jgi:hypothetical protein